MILEKAIRRRQNPLPPMGYFEQDSAIHTGSSQLFMTPEVTSISFLDESIHWAELLDLMVQWQALPIQGSLVAVQDVIDGDSLEPKPFYNPQASDQPDLAKASAYKGIALLCRDARAKEYGLEAPLLYEKGYWVQNDGTLIQERHSLGLEKWQVKASKGNLQGENLLPLFGYGCHAPSGCRLGDIQQVYANIGTDGKDTSLRLYRESDLRQMGIVQPQGGTVNGWHYRFMEPGASPSLISDILEHRIEVNLTQDEVTRTYVSVGYREISEGDQLICLTFKAK